MEENVGGKDSKKILQGYLSLKSRDGVVTSWKWRWFRLDGALAFLYYYESDQVTGKHLGSIDLTRVFGVDKLAKTDRGYTFAIRHYEKKYTLASSSERARDSWCSNLVLYIESVKKTGGNFSKLGAGFSFSLNKEKMEIEPPERQKLIKPNQEMKKEKKELKEEKKKRKRKPEEKKKPAKDCFNMIEWICKVCETTNKGDFSSSKMCDGCGMSYWLAASPSSSLSQLEKKSLPVHEPGFLNDVKKLRIRVFDLVGDYRTLSIFPESSASELLEQLQKHLSGDPEEYFLKIGSICLDPDEKVFGIAAKSGDEETLMSQSKFVLCRKDGIPPQWELCSSFLSTETLEDTINTRDAPSDVFGTGTHSDDLVPSDDTSIPSLSECRQSDETTCSEYDISEIGEKEEEKEKAKREERTEEEKRREEKGIEEKKEKGEKEESGPPSAFPSLSSLTSALPSSSPSPSPSLSSPSPRDRKANAEQMLFQLQTSLNQNNEFCKEVQARLVKVDAYLAQLQITEQQRGSVLAQKSNLIQQEKESLSRIEKIKQRIEYIKQHCPSPVSSPISSPVSPSPLSFGLSPTITSLSSPALSTPAPSSPVSRSLNLPSRPHSHLHVRSNLSAHFSPRESSPLQKQSQPQHFSPRHYLPQQAQQQPQQQTQQQFQQPQLQSQSQQHLKPQQFQQQPQQYQQQPQQFQQPQQQSQYQQHFQQQPLQQPQSHFSQPQTQQQQFFSQQPQQFFQPAQSHFPSQQQFQQQPQTPQQQFQQSQSQQPQFQQQQPQFQQQSQSQQPQTPQQQPQFQQQPQTSQQQFQQQPQSPQHFHQPQFQQSQFQQQPFSQQSPQRFSQQSQQQFQQPISSPAPVSFDSYENIYQEDLK